MADRRRKWWRIPLAQRGLIAGLLLGSLIWGLLEVEQTHDLRARLEAGLRSDLEQTAISRRARYDALLKRGTSALQLLARDPRSIARLRELAGLPLTAPLVVVPAQTWFLGDILEAGELPPLALYLRGLDGRVQQIVSSTAPGALEPARQRLAEGAEPRPAPMATRMVAGKPVAVGTVAVDDGQGRRVGYLTAIAPVDAKFLGLVADGDPEPLALIQPAGNEALVVASRDPRAVPVGAPMATLTQDFLTASMPIADPAQAGRYLELMTLLPRNGLGERHRDILGLSRQQRLLAAVAFVATFLFLLYFGSRRIERLRHRIEGFIRAELDGSPRELDEADLIAALEKRLSELTEGMLEGREAMRRSYELQTKIEQLEILRAITDKLEVGVAMMKDGHPEPVNATMVRFIDECGGMDNFRALRDGDGNGRVQLDCAGQGMRVFEFKRMAAGHGVQVTLVRDVTEVETQRAALEHHAMHDDLTALPNRGLLVDRLEQALATGSRTGQPVTLALMDLNHFKEVNETLGHGAGDLVLKQVVNRMLSRIAPDDTLARLGSDEFALLLRDCESERAYEICDELVSVLHDPLRVAEQKLVVDICIGLAEFPRDGQDPEGLIRKANVALCHAKDSHQSISVFDPQHDAHSRDRLALMADLREALRADGAGLQLDLQPQVGLHEGRVIAVEALLRWYHPDRGLILPSAFIPLAEQSSLIQVLTRWVVDEALHGLAAWRRLQSDLRVAVNLSARNLADPGLVLFIADRLGDCGLPADALILEITESAIMCQPQRSKAVLDALAAMGVIISVDDFGTGYSSLSYLSQLPVSELKIDRSFVQGMLTRDGDRTIVHATVDLGHNLGLQVVAEGVERPAELAVLKAIGCDVVQGFLTGRPVTATQLERLLAEGSALRCAG
jgi:diguanylate cyclase (GGDEF)-like protein